MKIKTQYAANITYSGLTFNTKLLIEYKHTGVQYYWHKGRGANKRECYTENEGIAHYRKANGQTVHERPGYWYIDRIAIPTINAKGDNDLWYINNCGDHYTINKVSKYGKKIHELLSNNINPFKK
ncbi:MAG: hypothetical protein ACK5DE_07700 [Bacteroidota bacterium]|jgi:hypothetical protein